MVQIAVSDELARAIAEAGPLVILTDSRGRAIGQVSTIPPQAAVPQEMPPERWAEIQRRLANPGEYVTLKEMKERLGWQDQP
jgi:hypothetical protein